MVMCLGQGADLHMAQLMQLPLTISCSIHTHNCFTALLEFVWDYPGEQVPER